MNPWHDSPSRPPLDHAAIEAVVLQAVRNVNLARDPSAQLEVSPHAPLFGAASPLDSIGMVALLLDIEESFEAAGCRVILSDDRAVSQRRSPFRSVDSLVDYIDRLVQGVFHRESTHEPR